MSDVDAVIGKMNPKLKPLASRLRRLIGKSLPQAEETVKWGNPCWMIGKKKIVFICEYRDHLNLGFFEGAKIKSKLLEGTGKGMRHIKMREAREIKEMEFVKILKEAGKISRPKKRTRPGQRG